MSAPGLGPEAGREQAMGAVRRPAGGSGTGQLAEEQAAIRRVATLIAHGAEPANVFSAIADELAHLVGADATFVARVDPTNQLEPMSAERPPEEPWEPEGTCTVLGSYGPASDVISPGFRVQLQPEMEMAAALRSGRPARIGGEALRSGPFGAFARERGLRASVAIPIVVDGCYWGVTIAATEQADFPPGTESRMVDFMELAAIAIANTKADEQRRKLADTQAAVRRLATLVARAEPPETVFAAVTTEVLRHFGSGTARMIRFESDGTATLIANEGASGPHVRVGEPWVGYPPTGLTATVRRTGRPARVDDYGSIPGGEPYLREGLRSAVAMPILVNGVLWGLIAVGWGKGPLPAGTEQRMTEFTDLVATAIANAQSRAELMSSRARIVAASDEARRRIERDLHDGAQQRLVGLAFKLRSMAATAPLEYRDIRSGINDVAAALVGVIDELRETSRGIHPAILSEAGLPAALRSLARRSAVPVTLDVSVGGRLPEPVEVAAYYVVSEMLTNAAKHARASVVEVGAALDDASLLVRVQDDGIGGADLARGSGLVGLKDRVEAIGGTFAVDSPSGRGTTVRCGFPLSAANAPGPVP